jgi:small-conductance mechanosensitive channel
LQDALLGVRAILPFLLLRLFFARGKFELKFTLESIAIDAAIAFKLLELLDQVTIQPITLFVSVHRAIKELDTISILGLETLFPIIDRERITAAIITDGHTAAGLGVEPETIAGFVVALIAIGQVEIKVELKWRVIPRSWITRALENPPPKVVFKAFGDNSLKFELRVWTEEMSKRPGSYKSELNFAIEKKLREHEIVIPFPQLDVHVRSDSLEIKNPKETKSSSE